MRQVANLRGGSYATNSKNLGFRTYRLSRKDLPQ